MTIWLRYNLIFYCGTLLSFMFFLIIAVTGNVIVGLIAMGCGVLFICIFLLKTVCPNCKTSLSSSINIFSKHYKGYQKLIPKKCVNCGYDLDYQVTEKAGKLVAQKKKLK